MIPFFSVRIVNSLSGVSFSSKPKGKKGISILEGMSLHLSQVISPSRHSACLPDVFLVDLMFLSGLCESFYRVFFFFSPFFFLSLFFSFFLSLTHARTHHPPPSLGSHGGRHQAVQEVAAARVIPGWAAHRREDGGCFPALKAP